ncbi:protein ralf-like 19 [Phtheirospermum japonicum]|uniref:Protein ralf-like 19 n=1 Tax=Phtheirospermum japonicum TaxID=374723 RepID=A0A830B9E9_9LAMI|nr:protein ralf-like 19 [Phtheirospermum japonicum]
MMESESTRRQLGGRGGYISYGAMSRNTVPCNQRGQSYYNCNSHQKANPYNRGCTKATKCARSTR